jgi:FKBP-type peptidyl-prolyl cis-trans isomerase FkpA
MNRWLIVALVLLLAAPVGAATKLKTEEDKTLYGVGLVIARQLAVFNLTPKELRLVRQGIYDGIKGRKPKVDFAVYSKKSVEMGLARRDAHGKKLEAKALEFLEEAEEEDGAVKTASGLVYLSRKEGEGKNPVETDKVKLHYRFTLVDGWEVDSSYKRGEPDVAELNNYFKCVIEGVQLMKPGGKAKLVCPPNLVNGKEGAGLIPPNATLLFEVELLEIMKPETEGK